MTDKAKIILLADGHVGDKVEQYLRNCDEHIIALYLTDTNSDRINKVASSSIQDITHIYHASQLGEQEHLDWLKKQEFDFLITVYWPYLIKPDIYELAGKGTINFHPALLPFNRGWYPHVYNIIDGSPSGVTLHQIDEGIDSGPVWAQKQVPTLPTDTAFTLYNRLQTSIYELFMEQWEAIKKGLITPIPQDHTQSNYHSRKKVDELDIIDPDKMYRGEELINLLRARSFGNQAFAYYIKDGKKIFLNLRLGNTNTLD